MAAQPRKNTLHKLNQPMSKGTFQAFIRHFPNQWLRNAGVILKDGHGSISRVHFFAIAHGLVEVGDFEGGSNFRLSQVAIADITGASLKTVRRVLALLERSGAISVVDKSRRPGGGTPVKVYQLVYSQGVQVALNAKDRNAERDSWKREPRTPSTDKLTVGNATPVQEGTQPQPVGNATPASGERNPTKGMSMNVQSASEASAPSPSPNGSLPDGRAEASEEPKKSVDEVIGSAWFTGDDFSDIVSSLEESL